MRTWKLQRSEWVLDVRGRKTHKKTSQIFVIYYFSVVEPIISVESESSNTEIQWLQGNLQRQADRNIS